MVAPPAEVDMANASQVRQELSPLATGVTVVVADMTATTFCDSTGFRALVMAHAQARAASTVLCVYPSLDTALAAPATG